MYKLAMILLCVVSAGALAAPCNQNQIKGAWNSVGMDADGRFLFCIFQVGKTGKLQGGSECGYVDPETEYSERIKGTFLVNRDYNTCVVDVAFDYDGYPVKFFYMFDKGRSVAVGAGGVLGITGPIHTTMVR